MDWYEENIEPEIRPVVKLLRMNGFNTECSCGHEMTVQSQFISDGESKRLDDLLFNNGFRNYEINIIIKRNDGHLNSYLIINF